MTLSIGLWGLLVVFHWLANRIGTPPYLWLWYQVSLAGFFIGTAIYIRQVFSKIERLDVITMLWRLFIIGMVGITLMLAMLMLHHILDEKLSSSMMTILSPAFYTISLFALLIFFLSGVFIYKRFILYQKTKRKLWSWNIFLGFMMVTLTLGITELFKPNGVPDTLDTSIDILFAVLLLYLATNVSWTAYLNFNQKLKALGLFVLVIVVSVTYLTALDRLPTELDLTDKGIGFFNQLMDLRFVFFIAAFTISYSAISILVLFFNLPTYSIFELKSSEIASFNKIHQAIQGNFNHTDILNTLLDASMLSSNARAGWVEILNGKQTSEVHIRKGIESEEIQALVDSYDMLGRVKEDRQYFLVKNTRRHKTFKHADSPFRSLLCMPIFVKNELQGAVYIANEMSNSFEDVTLASISSFVEQASTAIENAGLVQNAISLERYQEQIKIAKEVQSQLLPNALPNSSVLEFGVVNATAEEIGGDYFDIIRQDDLYRIAIGDVSGKGTTAAFYMAEIKGIFHALSLAKVSPKEFVALANQAISNCFHKGSFLTLTYLHIDVKTRELEMIRAGHCPSFYYSAAEDKISTLRKGTLGLGIVRNETFSKHLKYSDAIKFEAGDILTLYTDGVVEARNTEKEEFGYERFQEVLEANKTKSAQEIGEAVMDAVRLFAGEGIHDDYTLLIIRFL